MIISTAHIDTEDGARIVKRLCNHWKHKFEISEINGKFAIPFPEAQVLLEATPVQILMHIKSQTADLIEKYQKVVVDHLNRMAQQEFKTQWVTTPV